MLARCCAAHTIFLIWFPSKTQRELQRFIWQQAKVNWSRMEVEVKSFGIGIWRLEKEIGGWDRRLEVGIKDLRLG